MHDMVATPRHEAAGCTALHQGRVACTRGGIACHATKRTHCCELPLAIGCFLQLRLEYLPRDGGRRVLRPAGQCVARIKAEGCERSSASVLEQSSTSVLQQKQCTSTVYDTGTADCSLSSQAQGKLGSSQDAFVQLRMLRGSPGLSASCWRLQAQWLQRAACKHNTCGLSHAYDNSGLQAACECILCLPAACDRQHQPFAEYCMQAYLLDQLFAVCDVKAADVAEAAENSVIGSFLLVPVADCPLVP